MTQRLLENMLGELELVMLAVILACVIYLVYMVYQEKVKCRLVKEGMSTTNASVLGFDTVSDSTTHAGSGPRSGFSVGSQEPPVFHVAPYDPNELVGSNWDIYNNDADPELQFQVRTYDPTANTAVSSRPITFGDNVQLAASGLVAGRHGSAYANVPHNSGFKVNRALMGL